MPDLREGQKQARKDNGAKERGSRNLAASQRGNLALRDGASSQPPSSQVTSRKGDQRPSVILGLDEVAAEGDVGVHIVTVHGILTLSLEEPHPDAVTGLQGQHHTLTLHDAAVAGLRVQDDGRRLIVYHVHVGLLEVPAVHVEAEEVEATQGRHEVAGGHVEVAIGVHEDRVEEQRLEALTAVQGGLAAHREGRGACAARAAWAARLPFGALGALRAPVPSGTLFAQLPWRAQWASVPFITCGDMKGEVRADT